MHVNFSSFWQQEINILIDNSKQILFSKYFQVDKKYFKQKTILTFNLLLQINMEAQNLNLGQNLTIFKFKKVIRKFRESINWAKTYNILDVNYHVKFDTEKNIHENKLYVEMDKQGKQNQPCNKENMRNEQVIDHKNDFQKQEFLIGSLTGRRFEEVHPIRPDLEYCYLVSLISAI